MVKIFPDVNPQNSAVFSSLNSQPLILFFSLSKKIAMKRDPLKELTIMDSSTTVKATVFVNQFKRIAHVCEGSSYLVSGCTVQDRFGPRTTASQHPYEL